MGGADVTMIGGHEGLEVWRTPLGIEKVGHTPEAREGLVREARMLRLMEAAAPGFAPRLLADEQDGHLIEEDVGPPDPIADENALRYAAIDLLRAIRLAGLRHGDLSGSNLIPLDGGRRLVAIDWQEAHLLGESAPPKSDLTDSYLLMRYLASATEDTTRTARRWMAILRNLCAARINDGPLPLDGLSFVDLGAYEGDFCALAACERMHAVAIDRGGPLVDEDSIATGEARWRDFGSAIEWRHDDIRRWPLGEAEADVVLCLSTWPYVVREYGRGFGELFLRQLIDRSRVLYFETQLAGDGPGPDFLPDVRSVHNLLVECGAGAVEAIAAIPVSGREAIRTLWAVQ